MSLLVSGSGARAVTDPVTAPPGTTGTIFINCKAGFDSGDSTDRMIAVFQVKSGTPLHWLAIQRYSDNMFYCGWYIAGTDRRVAASDSGYITSGAWNTHILTWTNADGGDVRYYVDNSLVGSSGGSFTPSSSVDRLTLGNRDASEADANCGSDLAEFGQWNRVLTTAERAILQITKCPLSVPNGLVRYCPLIGEYSTEIDYVGGEGLTLTSTSKAAHPAVIYPSDDFVAMGASGGGGASVPGYRNLLTLGCG